MGSKPSTSRNHNNKNTNEEEELHRTLKSVSNQPVTTPGDPEAWWNSPAYDRIRNWAQGTPLPSKISKRPYKVIVYKDEDCISGLPPKSPSCVLRLCAISDTHSLHEQINPMPPADVLIHSGDFSNIGKVDDIETFATWFASQPYKYRIAIAGNHDKGLDEETLSSEIRELALGAMEKAGFQLIANGFNEEAQRKEARFLEIDSKNSNSGCCVYLEDSGVEIEGIRFWGSPWQPWFYDWAFNKHRGEPIRAKWDLIPQEADVWITHGPVWGFQDRTSRQELAGCADLLEKVLELQPVVHISGHIHESRGVARDETPNFIDQQKKQGEQEKETREGGGFIRTVFINASVCTLRYQPSNCPIVFDILRVEEE